MNGSLLRILIGVGVVCLFCDKSGPVSVCECFCALLMCALGKSPRECSMGRLVDAHAMQLAGADRVLAAARISIGAAKVYQWSRLIS